MLFIAKTAIISSLVGTIGIVGYKHIKEWKRQQEYELLYDTFLEYELDKYIKEYNDNRPKDEFEPFRVIDLEDLNQVCFSV